MKSTLLTLATVLALASIGCAKGPKGDAGASGGGRIVSTLNCSGTIPSGALAGIEIEYDAVLTAGGDVYSTANIIDSGLQISGTSFFAAGQAGAATGRVFVTNDLIGANNGGLFEVSLNRSTLVTSITYSDPDSSTLNYLFTAGACTLQNW